MRATAIEILLIGCFGLIFSYITASDAILLDGLYNLAYFIASLLTVRVANLIQKGSSDAFHFGYAYFEPLINGAKGALVLGVTIMAFIESVQAINSGGSVISAGPAVLYGSIATTACWILAWITRNGALNTKSPLVQADAENWMVNAAISSAVFLAFVCVYFLENTRFETFSPYIDPALVILIVFVSISVPVKMAWTSVMELLNRAPARHVVTQTRNILESSLPFESVETLHLRITQAGRTRMILAHVILPKDFPVGTLAKLDEIRKSSKMALNQNHPNTILDMIFTSDPELGASSPVSEDSFRP